MGRETRRVLVLVYVCVDLGLLVSGAIVYPSLHWSYQNPLFKGGTYRLNVLPGSKLNILCPHVAVSLVERQDTDNGLSYENFWRVDHKSYETCNVNSSIANNKLFLQCDNPLKMQFETLVFQPFNADPSRVFKKGTLYYFISTSTGSLDSLKGKSNGHCLKKNMKMEIYVCTGPEDVNCTGAKPTTKPAFTLQNLIQTTTSAPTTVKVETVELTSTKQTPPPQSNSSETELPPNQTGSVGPPDTSESKGKRESPPSISSNSWKPTVVIMAIISVMLMISIVVNIYLWRKQRSLVQEREKMPTKV